MNKRVQRKIVRQLIALRPKSVAELSRWLKKIKSRASAQLDALNKPATIFVRFSEDVRVDTKGPGKRQETKAGRSIAAMMGDEWRRLTRNSCSGGIRYLRARNWPVKGLDQAPEQAETQIVLIWGPKIRGEKYSSERGVDLLLCKSASSFLNRYCFDDFANAQMLDLREMRAQVPQTNALKKQKKVWIGPSKPGEAGWLWKGEVPANDRPSIRADAADDLCTFFLCNKVAHTFDNRYWILAGPSQAVVIVRSAVPVRWSRPSWNAKRLKPSSRLLSATPLTRGKIR